jgi:hypothetical protein
MALATEGLFASCTPRIAWNYHFGDREAFYAERFAQVNTQNSLLESQNVARQRPKRAAAGDGFKCLERTRPAQETATLVEDRLDNR